MFCVWVVANEAISSGFDVDVDSGTGTGASAGVVAIGFEVADVDAVIDGVDVAPEEVEEGPAGYR